MTLSGTQIFLVTFALIGGGVFVLMACSAFIGYAAAQLQATHRATKTDHLHQHIRWYLLGLIAFWFAAALATSRAGPLDFRDIAFFAFIPIVGGTLLSFTPPLRDLIRMVPTHWLIYAQFYRVLGVLFIFPYMTDGLLTRGFALNAGIGDVITGVLALPVAWLVLRGGERYKWVFVAWTAFGILDLIVAPASAAIFGFETAAVSAAGTEPEFPITLIPLFLGPPFGILIHIITLRNFWLRQVPSSVKRSSVAASFKG